MQLGFPMEAVTIFVILSIGAILVDLYSHNDDKPMSLKSASLWSIFWLFISCVFGGYLLLRYGSEVASLFFTGYALEKALSIDNLFVIMAIFTWFKVPEAYRHRVLYWGVIGAIIFRMIFVGIGAALLSLGWIVEFIFAAIIIYSGWIMLKKAKQHDEVTDEEVDYSQHVAYKMVHKFFPVSKSLHGNKFFIHEDEIAKLDREGKLDSVLDDESKKPEHLKELGLANTSETKDRHIHAKRRIKWIATPLFLALAVVELTDVMFAFDSVPAILAVTGEPFIVYSAMMFAILGLRTMYFVLEALSRFLVHLEKSVICLLFFIGFKMLLSATDHIFHHGLTISPNMSLVVVLATLTIGVVASFLFPKSDNKLVYPDTLVSPIAETTLSKSDEIASSTSTPKVSDEQSEVTQMDNDGETDTTVDTSKSKD